MVYIHLAEGFEEVEALTIVDILRRAQIDAKTVSMTGEHVTVSGNIITGMGPALAMEFALTLVRELKGTECEKEIASGLLFE